MDFTAIFISADHSRTLRENIVAPDIDSAATKAIYMTMNGAFGAGSSWFVAAVLQADCVEIVSACVEALVA